MWLLQLIFSKRNGRRINISVLLLQWVETECSGFMSNWEVIFEVSENRFIWMFVIKPDELPHFKWSSTSITLHVREACFWAAWWPYWIHHPSLSLAHTHKVCGLGSASRLPKHKKTQDSVEHWIASLSQLSGAVKQNQVELVICIRPLTEVVFTSKELNNSQIELFLRTRWTEPLRLRV